MGRSVLRLVPWLALAAPTLAAQNNTFVMPTQRATLSGNAYIFPLTPDANSQPARVQCIWERTQVPVAAAVFFGLDLRRTQYGPWRRTSNPTATWDIDLTMATAVAFAAGASPTFANNLGSNATLVFSGQVNLPPGTEVQVPAPFTVAIPFTTPFPFVPGTDRSLVADFRVRGYTASSNASWMIDGQSIANSTTTCCWGGGLTCRLGNGNVSNGYGNSSPLAPNFPLWIEYPRLQPAAPGAVVIGTQGPGGTWGGVPLPIDLTPAGAPGCQWYVSVMLWMPAVCNAAGTLRSPVFTVPNDQQLADSGPWFHQGLVLDASANSLGVVPTVAASFWLGNQVQPPGRIVYRLSDAAMNPTGTVDIRALIAQIHW